MTFEIYFTAKIGYAVNLPSRSLGLRLLEKIRSSLGIQLPLDRIDANIKYISQDITVEIPEKIAREAGLLFSESNKVIVNVPKESLNWVVVEEVNSTRDEETGEVVNAKIVYGINLEGIIEKWKAAGFPKNFSG